MPRSLFLATSIGLATTACHPCPERCPAVAIATTTSPPSSGPVTYLRGTEPEGTECYGANLDHRAVVNADTVDLAATVSLSCAPFSVTMPLGDPRSWSAGASLSLPVTAWLAYAWHGSLAGPPSDAPEPPCKGSIPVTATVDVLEATGGPSGEGVTADYHRKFRVRFHFATPAGFGDGACPTLEVTADRTLESNAKDFQFAPNDPCPCMG